jgi:hypothetical protein
MVNYFDAMQTVRDAGERVAPALVRADPTGVVQDHFYVRQQQPARMVGAGRSIIRKDDAGDRSVPSCNYEIRGDSDLTANRNLE